MAGWRNEEGGHDPATLSESAPLRSVTSFLGAQSPNVALAQSRSFIHHPHLQTYRQCPGSVLGSRHRVGGLPALGLASRAGVCALS